MPPLKIDGNLPIGGTQARCEQKQRTGFRLTGIKAFDEMSLGQTVKLNLADFEEALAPDILDVLNFVAAPAGEKLDDVKARTPGFTFMFDAPEVYVQGKRERRVVFGKTSG